MTPKEITKALTGSVNLSELAEVFRGEIDEVSLLGNVVSVSTELLCLESINDFSSNGYRIIRLKDVTDVSLANENDALRFMSTICKKENVFSSSKPDIDIKSWKSVFDFLKSSHLPVTVECSFDDAIDYYVGWVTLLDGSIATMKCFDGSGVIFEDDIKINLNFVSQVMVYEKYTTLTAKYINK